MNDKAISILSEQLQAGSAFSVEGRSEISIDDLLDAVPADAPQAMLAAPAFERDEPAAPLSSSPDLARHTITDQAQAIQDALTKIEKRARTHGRADVVILLDELSLVAGNSNWAEETQERLQHILKLISGPSHQ